MINISQLSDFPRTQTDRYQGPGGLPETCPSFIILTEFATGNRWRYR